MNAGLMCDQGNSAGAIQYFLRILEKQPNKWDQFAQLIPLLRRNGKLEDAEKIMSGTYFKYYKVTDSVTKWPEIKWWSKSYGIFVTSLWRFHSRCESTVIKNLPDLDLIFNSSRFLLLYHSIFWPAELSKSTLKSYETNCTDFDQIRVHMHRSL